MVFVYRLYSGSLDVGSTVGGYVLCSVWRDVWLASASPCLGECCCVCLVRLENIAQRVHKVGLCSLHTVAYIVIGVLLSNLCLADASLILLYVCSKKDDHARGCYRLFRSAVSVHVTQCRSDRRKSDPSRNISRLRVACCTSGGSRATAFSITSMKHFSSQLPSSPRPH